MPFVDARQPEPPAPAGHDPYAIWRYRDFRLYALGGLGWWIGQQMLATAVSWQVLELTHSTTALGLVGLISAIPVIGLAIPAGHAADRLNRQRIIIWCVSLVACGYLMLAAISHRGLAVPHLAPLDGVNHFLQRLAHLSPHDTKARFDNPVVPLLYLVLFLTAAVQTFAWTARSAILASLVPLDKFSHAMTWTTSFIQISMMGGPASAGLLLYLLKGKPYAYTFIYCLDACFVSLFVVAIANIRYQHVAKADEPVTFKTLAAGVHFVFRTKIILATITLDLFAVLLGGATALLPVFAESLGEDELGLGLLRGAPALGAMCMALILAHMPPMKNAGKAMLLAVAGFGGATIVFGLSHSFVLSLAMLFLTGAFDNISVVVRHTLVQVLTPDAMRGRVSAVNNVFIGASNELGEFESGQTAALFGPVASVVAGGIGTILVVAGVAAIWPQVRRFGSLQDARPEGEPAPPSKPD